MRQSGKEEEDVKGPTDSWTSEASTAGQRAIHLGQYHKGWAVVPPTGLQRSVAAASKHLTAKQTVSHILATHIKGKKQLRHSL